LPKIDVIGVETAQGPFEVAQQRTA